jgi:hypothetical protein
VRTPAPDPVVVKDLDGRMLEIREADTFTPQPPHAASQELGRQTLQPAPGKAAVGGMPTETRELDEPRWATSPDARKWDTTSTKAT